MALIISRNGKDARRVSRTSFEDEHALQRYLYDNPEVIPLQDLKENIHLLVLAREFQTESGPIDAVGIDRDGDLYLIETKLYKNPDKRLVVAQVLDYGASLWEYASEDWDGFREKLDLQVQEKFKTDLSHKLMEFFSFEDAEDAAAIIEKLQRNLEEGTYKFVVLMDRLHDRLKDLIRFLNHFSRFTIYIAEIEYYKDGENEIIIPRLFGAEMKKEAGVARVQREYSLDEHFGEGYGDTRSLFDILSGKFLVLDPRVTIVPRQQFIAFKFEGKRFCKVHVSRKSLKVKFPPLRDTAFDDPKKRVQTAPGHSPLLTVEGEKDIAYALSIAEQALVALRKEEHEV